jgi:hypothetical protein
MRSRPFRDLIIDPKTAKTLSLEADSRLLTSGNGTKRTSRDVRCLVAIGGKPDMAVNHGHTAVLQERRRHRRLAVHHLAVRVRSPVGSLDDKVGRTDVHRNV